LDNLISPEIINDELSLILEKLAYRPDIKTILEIGSSSGEGSTAALYRGCCNKDTKLFCMEVSDVRFDKLMENYPNGFIDGFNMASIFPFEFPSEEEITVFYNTVKTNLNNFPLKEVLRWLKQDLDYIEDNIVSCGGIEYIQAVYHTKTFDLVLIDGSEFTGKKELEKIKGSKCIVLDDINSFKNYYSYQDLSNDIDYRLIKENWKLRNGFAIFERKG
jgi:hypothetical protein